MKAHMAFRDVVSRIKPAVVGMGMLVDERDPLSVFIFGTGFIVGRDGWIMTNRHVAQQFMAERNGVIGVRNALARAVLFVDSSGREIHTTGKKAVAGIGMVPFPIIEVAFAPGSPRSDLHYETVPDLAACRISVEKLERAGIKKLPVLPLGDSSRVREGDEVGICGFPLGMQVRGDSLLRQATPIVQKGVIAAVLPWAGIGNPHAFQLDIHINGGSSGSPLFLAESGEVIGIVFAAPMDTGRVIIDRGEETEEIGTVELPTGFGYAVPSQRYKESPKTVTRLPDLIHEE